MTQLQIIGQLSPVQLQHVQTPVLNKISPAQAKNLLDADISRLTVPHLIRAVEPQNVSKLSDDAIQEIDGRLLKTIGVQDFQRIINPEVLLLEEAAPFFESLTEHQKKVLIAKVRSMKADSVPLHCLVFLSEIQVKNLSDKKRLQNLPTDFIYLLRSSQLVGFTSEDFTKEFIHALSEEAITSLNTLELCHLAEHLTVLHLKALDESHIHLIGQLTSEQLQHVKDPVLQKLGLHKQKFKRLGFTKTHK
ncbi:MAG: hypothetical protein HWD61_06315 [Parachlamydiaceae bacterium]|nr:MAG: hypothetical protein HWD61_06315 [Parachlamydiaceae bacterium]